MHVHITLGKGNGNADLAECFVNVTIQLMGEPAFIMGLMSPAQQLKI
jgi:hypothetical protein